MYSDFIQGKGSSEIHAADHVFAHRNFESILWRRSVLFNNEEWLEISTEARSHELPESFHFIRGVPESAVDATYAG